jgi:hypothetical protein
MSLDISGVEDLCVGGQNKVSYHGLNRAKVLEEKI